MSRLCLKSGLETSVGFYFLAGFKWTLDCIICIIEGILLQLDVGRILKTATRLCRRDLSLTIIL